jgi:uroporphyrinogen decarboxylase
MAYKGVLKDIQTAIDLGVPERLPCFALSEEMDVRLFGTTYEEYCQDGKKMAECQIRSISHFDYDWCWLQVDDCFEFEPLGVGTKGEGNILRATCEYLPFTSETIQNLKMPDSKKDGRMPSLLEGINRVKEHYGDSLCVVGRTAAPLTAVSLTFGMTETLLMLYDNPRLVEEAVKFFVDYQTKFGLAQYEAGADAIWFGECNASSHLISPDQYTEFAFEPADIVAKEYKKHGWIFLHASEENPDYIKKMIDLNISILSVGPGVNIETAKEICSGKMCLMGNVNPILTLERGTVEDVRRETEQIVRAAAPGGGYCLDSGEMVPRDTPEENMQAMIETARETYASIMAQPQVK